MKQIHILLFDSHISGCSDLLAAINEIPLVKTHVQSYEDYQKTDLADIAEVIFGWPDAQFVRRAKHLRWLHLPSAGANEYINPDMYANPEQIMLTNSTGVFGIPIAEHLMAMMCALAREIPLLVRNQDAHVWERINSQREIAGSTVGILGLGDIGGEFARRAKAMDCRVLAVKRTVCDKPDYVDELYFDGAGIDYVASQSDYLALCMPGTDSTRHILSRERIGMMKPSAIVLNIGRGQLIDQDALADALNSGRLGGAGLDVFSPEPLPAEHPLWDMKNVIITPHCSGFSPKNGGRSMRIFTDNLRRYINGETLGNLVDFDAQY